MRTMQNITHFCSLGTHCRDKLKPSVCYYSCETTYILYCFWCTKAQSYQTHCSTALCLVEDQGSRHRNSLLEQGTSEISGGATWAQLCSLCPTWHMQWKGPSFFINVLIFTRTITAFLSNGKYKLYSLLQEKDKLFFTFQQKRMCDWNKNIFILV